MVYSVAMQTLTEFTQDQVQRQRTRDFVRWLSCLSERSTPSTASARFLERWPRSLSTEIITRSIDDLSIKAAVAPGNTTDATWASPLIPQPLAEPFLALARAASLLGRIPGLRLVPFGARMPIETQGASFAWVGEGVPKPVSKMAFNTGVTLTAAKASGIIIVTMELARLTKEGTEDALRDELIGGLTEFVDKAFLDPTSAAVPGVKPGSITNGTTPVAGTGDLPKDVTALLNAFYAANPSAAEAVLITSPGLNAQLVGVQGRAPFGITIVTSPAAAGIVVALDPRRVFVADAGADFSTSQYASIEMVDTTTNPPVAATVMRSLYQENEVGYKVERFINWQAVTGSVKYLTVA
jgi:hypothetical protein